MDEQVPRHSSGKPAKSDVIAGGVLVGAILIILIALVVGLRWG